MTAAISAAGQGAGTVRLIEKNSIPGRKLLATGNGRCNLTNTGCSDAEEVLGFFSGLGLLTKVEEEGRVYPYSEQASAVQEALVNELLARRVEILCDVEVKAVESVEPGFRVFTEQDSFFTDAVILATGGKAGPQYGSTGDGYRFAKALGHTVTRLKPSLVRMVSDEPFFQALKGVRAKGQAELLRGNEVIDREAGEIQFTEDGLSGICIFNLSREFVRGDVIILDLFPGYGEEVFADMMAKRAKSPENRTLSQFFSGILHKKLIPVILSELSLDGTRKADSLDKEEIERITRLLKGWRIAISATKGWKEAQTTSGGVDLAEVDLDSMESKLVPGLYFSGEILNMDGKCGGYNLQWAWYSGLIAGRSAAAAQRKQYAQDT